MLKCAQWLGVLVALVSLAGTAQAGPKMYTGSLTFQGYGNTRTDGMTLMGMTTAASTWTVASWLAEPLGLFCNYKNLTHYLTGTPPVLVTGTKYISTAYTPPREGLIQDCDLIPGAYLVGAPITGSGTASTRTSSFMTAMGATACGGGGCNKSTAAIIMPGAPHTTTMGLFGAFTGDGIAGMGSGSFNYGYPVIYSLTYVTNGTGPGTFFPGGGPGTLVAAPGPGQFGGLAATFAGPNQFGGTMRLLGKVGHSFQFYYNNGVGFINTSLKFLFNAVGASYRGAADCPGAPVDTDPAGYPHNPCPSVTTDFFIKTDGYRNPLYTMMGTMTGTMLSVSRTWLYKTAFEWTTGVAYVTAVGGFDTVIQRTGFDNRTGNGSGTIQLVTPQLTNWIGQTFTSNTAGIAIMRITFVPEPHSWLMLGGGILLLALLNRVRAKR